MRLSERSMILAVWSAILLLCILIISQTRFLADLTAFMPKTPNERQQLLVDQLRDGVIARLIMIGIEGGDSSERARLSRELATRLRNTQLFVGVQNGDASTLNSDREYLYKNRYLLSPTVTPERFTRDGLHASINNSLQALSGNAGLVIKQLLPRDPTGETLQILEQFSGEWQPRVIEGVWASRDGNRTLLLAYTRAAGTDTNAQSQAIHAIRQTFDEIPGRDIKAGLVMSGTSVFSVSSRNTIKEEVGKLATASLALVICLLFLVYRSFTLLALSMLPVVCGALVGIAAVSLGFGQVHGLTLGFGTTLIGEAVDYSIYYFIQQNGVVGTRVFWRTIWLGVLTSISGFMALLFSGFPGLAQLGLYSISGLVAAALVTRFILPVLTPREVELRDLSKVGGLLDRLFDGAARFRWLVAIIVAAAMFSILFHSGDIWNRRLSALSPISKSEQKLDMELRSDMGAPDMRYLAAFTAPSKELALEGAEQVGTVLQQLVKDKTIGEFNSPALVLPSVTAQRLRQSSLPDTSHARLNLDASLKGIPIKPERLEGFLTDLQAARERKPLDRNDLNGTSLALMLDSLLVKRDNDYMVLMPLRATGEGSSGNLIDIEKVNTALKAQLPSNVVVIDLLEESTNLFDSYLHDALVLSGLGSLVIIVLLFASLRSLSRTLMVALPLGCAVLSVTACLLLAGIQLTILHLVGLLLVVAVGSNYALFFDSASQIGIADDRRQTQVSLLVANLATVGSFGLLGLSKVPVLSYIGSTVGLGAFLAFLFAAILTRKHPHAYYHRPI
jgi:predicted exporter